MQRCDSSKDECGTGRRCNDDGVCEMRRGQVRVGEACTQDEQCQSTKCMALPLHVALASGIPAERVPSVCVATNTIVNVGQADQ